MTMPPRIPSRSPSTVSAGSITRVAASLGATSFLTGSAAIERSASICSVTFMVPSSAVMPEPMRPPTISAVSTGPSSRTRDFETTVPM